MQCEKMSEREERLDIIRTLIPKFKNVIKDEIESVKGNLGQSGDRSVAIVLDSVADICVQVVQNDEEAISSVTKNESLEELEVLTEFFWEQLNIGHWKEVAGIWRELYTLASLLKVILMLAIEDSLIPQAIKICDLGLLLGAPILDNILSKIAFRLHGLEFSAVGGGEKESLAEEGDDDEVCMRDVQKYFEESQRILQNQFQNRFGIKLISRPSLETFVHDYFLTGTPAVLEHSIAHWPAIKKWNVEYIKKRTGSRTVPIEIGSKYTSEDWTQKLVRMEDFVDNYVISAPEGSHKGYLAQHQLFHQIPELMEDLRIPEYCYVGTDSHIEINAWFGPAGTVSPTHYDPKHNLLAQVFGSKIIRLFPPSEWDLLYPHDSESMLFNTSQIDVEDPEFPLKFPKATNAKYTDVLLQPGMVLYMPPKWAHFVKSLSPSFSISFWFE